MLFRLMGHQIGETILGELENKKEEERVYSIATDLLCDCPYIYEDEAGEYKEFFVDVVDAVCREAGKRCVLQVLPPNACMTHQSGEIPRASIALLGKWVDICVGWTKVPTRMLFVDYTESLKKINMKVLFVIKHGNPNNFDPNDITGKKIGFEDGIFTDKACLSHAKDRIVGVDTMQPQQEIKMDNYEQLLDALRHDEIDAFDTFDIRMAAHLKDEFQFIGDDIGCLVDNSLYGIKRKDNPLTWFDDSLAEMKRNGKYYATCHQSQLDHGHRGTLQCHVE
ncbi:uncharacterized protein [Ptychodera flava]|uniref:uncharacterized protein n=1 Tax=Ptychodera flava TaxID=63121 RepID=UPI00396AA828